ncbi:serine/threonine-protein kinase [Streptomyces sp. BPTC-684]|uniref:serine/threonine-protein kinase n=1 Tax=Streptomyces sp. BPTC-684 TaxID=3043734 RepID=UPI0024B1B5D7|nr:serine/threonine-protein kinase [Streptomyces sp. BPTC-684]WHM37258.1 serine/threonine-protein kinase [Streptomyces sp. BPTC-684]
MQPLEAGEPRTIGAYRLLGRLGAGGMGRVYLGRSAGGRTVAVKVVHPHFALDEQFRARFRHEVEAARRVGGAWTAPVLDADPEASVPWVATGYVAGPSLAQAVTAHGPLPEHAVRALGAGLAEALAAVHALGLVHRDVKPSNVLLTLDGPRLIDFGIARATDGTASLTASGVSIGSPGYMSPEQILGKGVTGAADVFSLGAVLAYAATGAPPFPGDSSAALLYKVVHEEPELGGRLDGELRAAVDACLAKTAAARPAPAELARRLAPDGAAALVAGGWLPGALVEEVSRSAVRLLDLEPEAQDAQASGPVAFTSPAVGVFGPPDASYGAGAGVGTGAGASQGSYAYGNGSGGTPGGTSGTGSVADAVPAPRTPEPPTTPPRVSLSVGTAVEPGERGRGRRISCTVALAVAGAVAAATVGAAFLFDLMPGGGDQKHDSAASSGPSRSSTPADSGPGATGGPAVSEVPKAFLGTWKGPMTEATTGQPHGDLTAVFKAGATGEDVLRTSSKITVLGTTVECFGVGKLVSGTAQRVTIEERTDTTRENTVGLCTTGTATLVFTRNSDGTLKYESREIGAGNPYATLVKETG